MDPVCYGYTRHTNQFVDEYSSITIMKNRCRNAYLSRYEMSGFRWGGLYVDSDRTIDTPFEQRPVAIQLLGRVLPDDAIVIPNVILAFRTMIDSAKSMLHLAGMGVETYLTEFDLDSSLPEIKMMLKLSVKFNQQAHNLHYALKRERRAVATMNDIKLLGRVPTGWCWDNRDQLKPDNSQFYDTSYTKWQIFCAVIKAHFNHQYREDVSISVQNETGITVESNKIESMFRFYVEVIARRFILGISCEEQVPGVHPRAFMRRLREDKIAEIPPRARRLRRIGKKKPKPVNGVSVLASSAAPQPASEPQPSQPGCNAPPC